MSREAFVRETTRWINTHLAPRGGVEPDTALFADGLLGSLQVLRLIAWTERATGRRIPDEMIRMDHFRSVRHIARTFVEEG